MSDQLTKIAFGKILGEIYRLQRAQGLVVGADEGRVYGLLNGIEQAIDEELNSVGFISNEKTDHAQQVLNVYLYDESKLDDLDGFYDIEMALEKGGVDRSDAISIFRYFLASRRYVDAINKMDSGNSPIECKDFALRDWDR